MPRRGGSNCRREDRRNRETFAHAAAPTTEWRMEPRLAEEFEAFKRRTRKTDDAPIQSFLSAPRLDPAAPDVFAFTPALPQSYEQSFPEIDASRRPKAPRPLPLTKAHRAQIIRHKNHCLPGPPKHLLATAESKSWMTKDEMQETLRLQLLQMDRANASLTRPQTLDLREMPAPEESEPPKISVCLCGLARFSKFKEGDDCAACCDKDALAVCARIEAGLGILACLSSQNDSISPKELDKLVHLVTGVPINAPLLWSPADVEEVRDNFLRLARYDKGLRLISGTWLASLSVASEVPYFMLTAILRSFPYIATVGLTVDSISILRAFHGPLCIYLRTRNCGCPKNLTSLFHEAAASMLSSGEVEASSPGRRQLAQHFLLAVVSLALWMEETAQPERRLAAATCLARSILAGYLECLRASVRAGGSVFFAGEDLQSEASLRARLLVPAGEAEMALVSIPLACLFVMIINFVPLGTHNLSQEAAHAVATQVVKRGAEIVVQESPFSAQRSVSSLVENLEPSVAVYMLMSIVTKSVLWQAMRHPWLNTSMPATSPDTLGTSDQSLTPIAALLFSIIAHGGQDRVAAAVIQMAMISNRCDAASFLQRLQKLFPYDPPPLLRD